LTDGPRGLILARAREMATRPRGHEAQGLHKRSVATRRPKAAAPPSISTAISGVWRLRKAHGALSRFESGLSLEPRVSPRWSLDAALVPRTRGGARAHPRRTLRRACACPRLAGWQPPLRRTVLGDAVSLSRVRTSSRTFFACTYVYSLLDAGTVMRDCCPPPKPATADPDLMGTVARRTVSRGARGSE